MLGAFLRVRQQLVTEAVLYRLDTPELAAALSGAQAQDAETDAAQSGLESDKAQLTELATAYGEQQITFPEYLAARKPIEARIEAGQRKVGRLTRTTAIAEASPGCWASTLGGPIGGEHPLSKSDNESVLLAIAWKIDCITPTPCSSFADLAPAEIVCIIEFAR